MKLVCLGDSLVFGPGVPRRETWGCLVEQETGITLINRGVCGDTTGGMLARFGTDVLSLQPDTVLLLGGSNDLFASAAEGRTNAQANLFALVHQALAHGILPLVGTPLPVDLEQLRPELSRWMGGYTLQRALDAYASWILEFSAVFGLLAVDFYHLFSSSSQMVRQELYLDGLHPNREGHRLMAQVVKRTVHLLDSQGSPRP